ncbi:hypothetical protein D031_3838A, partial [Vibrio parahaemolyticus VP-48]
MADVIVVKRIKQLLR